MYDHDHIDTYNYNRDTKVFSTQRSYNALKLK